MAILIFFLPTLWIFLARIATDMASQKLTDKFNRPIKIIPKKAMINSNLPMPEIPIDEIANEKDPVDNVTWRTSSGNPKNMPSCGVIPSIKPREILPPKPEILWAKNEDIFSDFSFPKTNINLLFFAIASGSLL